MSRHRFAIEFEVDDAKLARHPDTEKHLPKDVSEWLFEDLMEAYRHLIVDNYDAYFGDHEELVAAKQNKSKGKRP